MIDLTVRIVQLEPMTVACSHVIGESPERVAWKQLRAWAEPKGLLGDVAIHPVFGFNNPNPSSERKEYGYEFWISVEHGAIPEGNISIKEFSGGLYAATECRLLGERSLQETWRLLWEWVGTSKYQWRQTHELERLKNPMAPENEIELDLLLPVEETSSTH